jgi:predicted dehydrogenase
LILFCFSFPNCKVGETSSGQVAFSFGDRYAVAYAREVQHFADMILRGAAAKVTQSHCKVVAAVCDAALHSATNKRICRFDWH